MGQCLKVQGEGRDYNCSVERVQWQAHAPDCERFKLYVTKSKGGDVSTSEAEENRGQPMKGEKLAVTRTELQQQIKQVAGPALKSITPLSLSRFMTPVRLDHLICSICGEVVDQPVQLRCMWPHIFK